MDLIEVDHVTAEPSQAVLALLADRAALQRIVHLPRIAPDHSTLGKNIGPPSGPLRQSLRDDLLGMSQTVNGGYINPVHAQFQCAMDSRDRLRVVLCAPSKFPIAADGPSTKADRR